MLKKALIIEEDKKTIEEYKEYFKDNRHIKIVKVANDGKEAINLIESRVDYDLIILDLILPNIDGFEVLDYLKKNNIKKKVIVTSSFNSNEVIKKVMSYNVDYYLLKPSNLECLRNKIIGFNSFDSEVMISLKNKLHSLGMPSSLSGYFYVRDAILMAYSDSKYMKNITKLLYPDISLRYDTTAVRVERMIRHAIEACWLRGNMEVMDEIFGNSVDINKGKPTNSEFIFTLVELLKLEYYSKNKW